MTSISTGIERSKIVQFVVTVGFAFYLPVILLWIGVIPYEFRFYLLVLMTIVMVGYAFVRRFTWQELGFRSDTLQQALIWNGGLSLLFLTALVVTYLTGTLRSPTIPASDTLSAIAFFVFYIFISGPCQEFLYRSVMFALLNRAGIKGGFSQIAISAVTFSFLHIFYNDIITLLVGLLMGIIWGYIYYRKPNFWGVMISHSVLGAVAIAVGLI